MGWVSVSIHSGVTITLTSILISIIILFQAYLLHFQGRNPIFGVWIHLGMAECRIQFCVTLTLTLNFDLISSIMVS